MIKKLAERLAEFGITSYFVGGCVRDKLMGNIPDDIDVCLVGVKDTVLLEQLLSEFSSNFVKEVGKAFPVWIVAIGDTKYDVALARTEKKIGLYRTEFFCKTEDVTIEEDLRRRDLSINSIAENILTGEMIDPFNGIEHIKLKIAHPTSEAFEEDSLRVLRAARFISRFELTPSNGLLQMCTSLIPLDISPERVGGELMKTFKQAVKPSMFFRFLFEVHWLGYYFDELLDLVATNQSPQWHPEGNAFEHTMYCLDATKEGDWFTRTVMLCHDLGKSTTTILVDGKLKSPGHEEAGVPMTDDILKRIHFTDHKTIGQIKMLVRLHMVGTREVISEKTIRKTLRQLMQCQLTYDHLVEVCRCDKSGRPPLPPYTPDIGQDRARQLIENGDMIPVVTGKLLMAQGYDNYREWGDYIDKALELQDKGILTIHNWKQRLKESGIKLPKGE